MNPHALGNLVDTVQLTDYELRRALRDAADDAQRIITSYGDRDALPTGKRMRAMQLDMARLNAEMWSTVGSGVTVGIGDAFYASAEWQASYDTALLRAVGAGSPYWTQSMLATSQQGLPNYLARKQNGFTLSERVYRNTALSKGYVDRTINNALLLGKSAKELAQDVRKYISPSVPGGLSYAAMRLGRTEVSNAYHANAVSRYAETPWVERVRWNLSGSHPKPDECNEYAEGGNFPKQPGVWRADSVPAKPHPQCLCYVTPEVMDLDEFAKKFKAGKYDSYIDKQMGCSRVA